MSALQEIIIKNLTFILAIFTIALCLLLIWNFFLHRRLSDLLQKNNDLFSGNKAANLEELILNHSKTLKILDKDIQELYNISNQINSLSFKGLHKFALVRFNPFKDVGGDQSFSFAFLNGKNNGIVVSSLYTREGTRIFSKSIKSGVAEKYPFTEEEEQAIKLAIENDSKKTIN